MDKKGFTLTELVIVLSILGILSVTFTPVIIGAMRRSQLNACTEQLASHIRYARSLAMAANATRRVQFALNNPTGEHSYQVCTGTVSCTVATRVANPLNETDPNGLYVVLRNSSGGSGNLEFQGITFNTIGFTGQGPPTYYIHFDSTGDPISLTANGEVRLQNQNGDTRSVFIIRSTGAVMVGSP